MTAGEPPLIAVQILQEDGQWVIRFPGLPIRGQGGTRDEALDDAVAALREYAGHWSDHLYKAPDHAQHWEIVFWVDNALDHELSRWLIERAEASGLAEP